MEFCRRDPGIGECEVVRLVFRAGSVIVDFTLRLPSSVSDQYVVDGLAEAIDSGEVFEEFEIDTSTLSIGSGRLK